MKYENIFKLAEKFEKKAAQEVLGQERQTILSAVEGLYTALKNFPPDEILINKAVNPNGLTFFMIKIGDHVLQGNRDILKRIEDGLSTRWPDYEWRVSSY